MGAISFWQSVKEDVSKSYAFAFEQNWPGWLAGIILAGLALMIFLWQSPWAVAAGFRNWGDWFYYLVGVYDQRPLNPWLHPVSLSNSGIIIGALASALLAREFKIRRAPTFELTKGLIGGVLMGAGAAVAGGCNIGGFYTAIGMFSMGGFAMMFGLGAGAYIGLRYLIWEMEHIPAKAVAFEPAPRSEKTGIDWRKVQPYVGGLLVLTVLATFYAYALFDQAQTGGWLFFGLLIGLVMQRSRFCFVRAFRCPFMTGEADMVKAVALSLMIYASGSAVIKWNYLQPDTMGVYHPFWLGSLLGGLIFGIGMLLAGGCASGTLWRIGEGHTKLMVAFIGFTLTNSPTLAALKDSGLLDKLGKPMFLPELLSWQISLPLLSVFFAFWAFVAIWNEKNDKFVII